ncbi:bacteriohopanetetrol glucosamine biosynthesis glycosyltransferase HpnI [Terriglobus sp.]|uniref:bacteriohopanetetrol glucosamine biosynthesis glycosyltransferase HpnI n=1 Tax=Terriglobus sp. TaxID=1889013 RepID=UPI003AFF8CC7
MFPIPLITAVLTYSGIVYLVLALVAMRRFSRAMDPPLTTPPPTVSILKPVKGSDPGLYRAFASHCQQQYAGRYELLLGASETGEPLEEMAAQLMREFPGSSVRVIQCPERLGLSGKVSTLEQMVPHALGEVLVINDADIRVGPNYLQHIAAHLAQPNVGLVTATYFAQVAERGTVWSKLEALGISTEFLPGILSARLLERGVRFGLGGTLALRRETLEAIGGFAVLRNHVADDYELGARVYRSGRTVALMREVVATTVPRYSFRGFAEHQLRWGRTVRDARPAQYFSTVTLHAVPWALAHVIATAASLPSITLLSMVLFLRTLVALSGGVGLLRDGQVLRDILLLPVRDCFSLLLWAWVYASDEIVWRGERFRLRRGVMERV